MLLFEGGGGAVLNSADMSKKMADDLDTSKKRTGVVAKAKGRFSLKEAMLRGKFDKIEAVILLHRNPLPSQAVVFRENVLLSPLSRTPVGGLHLTLTRVITR